MHMILRMFVHCLAACAALATATVQAQGAGAPTGRVERFSLKVGERDRTYSLYVPSNVVPERPLLLVLHGAFSDGSAMRADTEFVFDRLADKHGFVVAYPDALMQAWNDCRKELAAPARQQNDDDVSFLRRLIAAVARPPGASLRLPWRCMALASDA